MVSRFVYMWWYIFVDGHIHFHALLSTQLNCVYSGQFYLKKKKKTAKKIKIEEKKKPGNKPKCICSLGLMEPQTGSQN